ASAPPQEASSDVSDASEPPPWPGSDEPDTVGAIAPTATALPVRTTEGFGRNQAPAHSGRTQIAPEYVAIPVRESPEPGERLQPLPLSAPTPVSGRYTPTEEGDVWHITVQQMVAAEAITALVRELALQSQLVARDGSHWLLRV